MRLRWQKSHGQDRWVVDYRDGRGKRHQKFFKDRDTAVLFYDTLTPEVPSRRRGPTYTARNIFDGYINATESRREQASTRALIYKLTAVCRVLDSLGVTYAHQLTETAFQRMVAHFQERGRSPHTIHRLWGRVPGRCAVGLPAWPTGPRCRGRHAACPAPAAARATPFQTRNSEAPGPAPPTPAPRRPGCSHAWRTATGSGPTRRSADRPE